MLKTAVPVVGLVVWAAAGPLARAAFVGGVESFDGTTKDAVTWEEFAPNSTFAQNNALNVSMAGPDFNADYTTTTQQVGVGDFVRVQVTVNSVGEFGSVGLFLTNDSGGTGARTADDNRILGVRFGNSSNAIHAFVQRGAGGDTYTTIVGADHPTGSTYIYEISRTGADSATLKVFDGATELGSATVSPLSPYGDIPNDLYISLVAGSADVTFDNVMINTTVPEPAATGMILLGLASTIARRRRC